MATKQTKAAKPVEEGLYGSSVQPSMIEIGGKQVQLGEVVAKAHAVSGMTVAAWNAQPQQDRETMIAMTIEFMKAEAGVAVEMRAGEGVDLRDLAPGALVDAPAGCDLRDTIYTDHNGITVIGDASGHRYAIGHADTGTLLEIHFQNGPIKEAGINGVQNEHLLAILIHRTKILNEKFPCDENVQALHHMKLGINAFQSRTANRIERGVEGTNTL